jgi:hypothetical protein
MAKPIELWKPVSHCFEHDVTSHAVERITEVKLGDDVVLRHVGDETARSVNGRLAAS